MTGKTAKKNKEVDKVKADNERLVKERDEAKAQAKAADERANAKYQSQYELNVSKLKASFNTQVNAAVEKQTAELKKDRLEAIEKFNKLLAEHSITFQENKNLKLRLNECDDVLTIVAKML